MFDDTEDFASSLVEGMSPSVKQRPWMSACQFVLGTVGNLAGIINECIAAKHFALDLETSGLDNRVVKDPVGRLRTVDHIAGVCLSPDGITGYYIPLAHKTPNIEGTFDFCTANVPWEDFAREFSRLTQAVERGEAVAIYHNGKFDQEFLQFNGFQTLGEWDKASYWEDTLILAYMRNTRARVKGLKDLSAAAPDADETSPTGGPGLGMEMIELYELWGHEGEKRGTRYDFTTRDPTLPEVLWYGGSDAICTYRLFNLLYPVITGKDSDGKAQDKIYAIEKACVAATRWMERNRIYVSVETVQDLITVGQKEWFASIMEVYSEASKILKRNVMPLKYKVLQEDFVPDDPHNLLDKQLEVAEKKAKDLPQNSTALVMDAMGKEWPPNYDVNSPKQLGTMFDEMGVPGLKRTESSKQVMTTKEEIARIIEEVGESFPFMGRIKRFREISHALSSYLRPMLEDIDPEDHTMRINFNAHKVDTGRYSTPAPQHAIQGWPAINLQSLPATYDPKRPECMARIRECITARRADRYIVACVAEGSRVPTSRGLVPIQEVRKGDLVGTEVGMREVSDVARIGTRPVLRITTSKGFTLRVTPDHLVYTTDPKQGLVWKPAEEICPGDWVIQKASLNTGVPQSLPPTPQVSPYEAAIKTPAYLTLDLAEFLGRFMGDGHIGHIRGKPRSVGLALGSDVREILPQMNRFLKVFGVEFKEKTKGDVSCWSNPLARWFFEVTQKGDVHSLRVPECVQRAEPQHQGAFLRGLFDADGSVGLRPGDGVSLWVTSDDFAQDVQLLLLNLGIQASRKKIIRESNFGHNEGWSICVAGIRNLNRFQERVGFVTKRKQMSLTTLISTGRNRDITEFFPLDICKLAVPRQRCAATNRIHTNGKRKGRVSRSLLEAARRHQEDIDVVWMSKLLDENLLFDTVAETAPDGEVVVHDLTVPEVRHFQANGILVHNCDYSGVELRIVTNLSREPKWLMEFFHCANCDRTFDTGNGSSTPPPPPARCPNCGSDKIGDLHTLTALSIYGQDAQSRPDWKKLRGGAKSTNFALCYGGGGSAVQRAVGVDKNEGWRIKNMFDKTYVGLEYWWKQTKKFAKQHAFVRTAFNRKYPLPDINSSDGFWASKAERNATNGPVQGSSADITKTAMAFIYRECKNRGWLDKCQMIITMHDELVFEIDGDILEEAIHVLIPIMTRNQYILAMKWPVPLTCDVEIGTHWAVPWDLNAMRFGEVRYDGDKKIKEPQKPKADDFSDILEYERAKSAFPEKLEKWKAIPHTFPETLRPLFRIKTPVSLTMIAEEGLPQPDEDRVVVAQPQPESVPTLVEEAEPETPEPPPSLGSVGASLGAPVAAPPKISDGVYEFQLTKPLTLGVLERIASVIVKCDKKGRARLKLLDLQGKDIPLDRLFPEPIMVNPSEFYFLAGSSDV